MYYLVYGFLYLISLLPMWMLYGLSDFFCWLLFRVFGYRHGVISANLALAFPEKSEQEREAIIRRFQQNFTDTFIETIKLISANQDFITSRMTGEYDVFNQLYDKGLKCQVHMGHNFNWELANVGFASYSKHTLLGVYMPIKNQAMDRIFRQLRSKTGTVLVPATDMKRNMLQHRDKQYLLGLVADQVPSNPEKAYWLNFFGIPSAFIPGPEKGARAGNIPVVFVHITKKKRGYYYLHAQLVTENPRDLPEGELTRQYRDFLEMVIRKHPDMWLWSHRRWKKGWDPKYLPHWIDQVPAPTAAFNPYQSKSR